MSEAIEGGGQQKAILELIRRVFAVRNAAHIAHWATDSYARHMALGSFYDDIIEAIDGIVEAYQGWFGLLQGVKANVSTSPDPDDIASVIADEAQWIAENRTAISGGNAAIENLVDGLTDTYMTTFYKLANLK